MKLNILFSKIHEFLQQTSFSLHFSFKLCKLINLTEGKSSNGNKCPRLHSSYQPEPGILDTSNRPWEHHVGEESDRKCGNYHHTHHKATVDLLHYLVHISDKHTCPPTKKIIIIHEVLRAKPSINCCSIFTLVCYPVSLKCNHVTCSPLNKIVYFEFLI